MDIGGNSRTSGAPDPDPARSGDPWTGFDGHEQVVLAQDPGTGVRMVVAIHSTRLGPALGGTRMADYADAPSPGAAAYADALRLSRAMTYKNALAGLDHGGGKGVILADSRAHPRQRRPTRVLQAYGRLVSSLDGPVRDRRRRRHDRRGHGRHRRGLPVDHGPLAGRRAASATPASSPRSASSAGLQASAAGGLRDRRPRRPPGRGRRAPARWADGSSATSSAAGRACRGPRPVRLGPRGRARHLPRRPLRRRRSTSCWPPGPRCSPRTRWAGCHGGPRPAPRRPARLRRRQQPAGRSGGRRRCCTSAASSTPRTSWSTAAGSSRWPRSCVGGDLDRARERTERVYATTLRVLERAAAEGITPVRGRRAARPRTGSAADLPVNPERPGSGYSRVPLTALPPQRRQAREMSAMSRGHGPGMRGSSHGARPCEGQADEGRPGAEVRGPADRLRPPAGRARDRWRSQRARERAPRRHDDVVEDPYADDPYAKYYDEDDDEESASPLAVLSRPASQPHPPRPWPRHRRARRRAARAPCRRPRPAAHGR